MIVEVIGQIIASHLQKIFEDPEDLGLKQGKSDKI